MWVKTNVNPCRKEVGDCVIRAIAVATGRTWYEVYDGLYLLGRDEADMMNSDEIWGLYLYNLGFEPFLLPEACPRCTTVNEFTKRFPHGTYIIGTGSHAICVIDGDYYDSWDSGNTAPTFFWRVR